MTPSTPPPETEAPPPELLDALHRALVRLQGWSAIRLDELEPMRVKGLVHDHIRIRGRGVLLRVPRLSQVDLPPVDNLAYQAACFSRAGAGGHAPRLHGVLPPSKDLPFGALLVDEIAGRPARLPGDLAAMAEALATIHALPLPDPADRSPLASHADPVAGTLAVIERQAAFLPGAEVPAETRTQIEEELAWAKCFAAESATASQPVTLVATDTHPGNFLVDGGGRAFIVDLEKALYGAPAIDLAHCSLYSSTTWERDSSAVLTQADIRVFYGAWLARLPTPLAGSVLPWLAPLRRLTWLRTMTWCARWRAEMAGRATEAGAAESHAYATARIAHFFDPDVMRRMRGEWLGPDALDLDLKESS
ncbi:MAG: phosphotransferase [Alphaproteobacteria bacterium]